MKLRFAAADGNGRFINEALAASSCMFGGIAAIYIIYNYQMSVSEIAHMSSKYHRKHFIV